MRKIRIGQLRAASDMASWRRRAGACARRAAMAAMLLGAVFGAAAQEKQEFGWSSYQPVDIDDVIQHDSIVREGARPGVKLWTPLRKLRLRVVLLSYPERCDTEGFFMVIKALGFAREKMPRVTTCIRFRSDGGRVTTAFVQDQVGEHLPKEVRLGERLDLYVAYFYMSEKDKAPGLLVSEFQALQSSEGEAPKTGAAAPADELHARVQYSPAIE